MKKSHRKDVIIARIIFGGICLTALALLSSLVVFVHGLWTNESTETESQSESQEATWSEWVPESESEELMQTETEETEVVEETEDDVTYVWARKNCKIRSLPNTESEILGTLAGGQKIETTGEESGWVIVVIDGKTGYIRSDLVTFVKPEGGM